MKNKYAYGHQSIDETDIEAVLQVLKSEYLTSGPFVEKFEQAICNYTGSKYCVAVSNATAGLHIACLAIGLKNGDEGITSPITFLSSANCICYTNAKPIFADIEYDTANINPDEIIKHITADTKVIIPVHFAGQSCDMEKIWNIARDNNIAVIEDAAHAIGSSYKDTKVGSCKYSDMTVFSFHPVKNITTGEGGAITTNNPDLYHKLKALRSHGVYKDGKMLNTWEYELRDLGYNYRITDFQAALGLSQLNRIEKFKNKRRWIVDWYNKRLNLPHLVERDYSESCFHLYPVLIENRSQFYLSAKEEGLYLQVHYIPVHLQPWYSQYGYSVGNFPNAEAYYSRCISLPLYPSLEECDLEEIARRIERILK